VAFTKNNVDCEYSVFGEITISATPGPLNLTMSLADTRSASIMATAAAPGAPGLMTQIGMAGGAAVITVTFIHPIDVVKVCN
jgi:hypothetical protein